MTTVAAIAAEAFDAVEDEFSDVIQACTLTRTAQGAYDPATGEYDTTATQATGRALVATETPITDVFPDYVAGPGDVLIYLEGLSIDPAENDSLLVGSTTRTVTKAGDIVGVGTFFAVVAR